MADKQERYFPSAKKERNILRLIEFSRGIKSIHRYPVTVQYREEQRALVY